MRVFGFELSFKKKEPEASVTTEYPIYYDSGILSPIPFDGEKTPYEMGQPLDVYPSYYALRYRAWEAFLKKDVVQNAISKYCLWVVGHGLKIQSEPVLSVLQQRNISISEEELKEFTKNVEANFRLFAEMKQSVYSNEQNLHDEAAEALKNAIISGDVLCITRYDGDYPTIETIDGMHVKNPIATEYAEKAETRGNKIIDGVEVDKKSSHVAYYVQEDDGEFKRVEAFSKKLGRRQAWLFYVRKSKKSETRGMNLLTAVLETSEMLDRYKTATLGSAEENAKVMMSIEHNHLSDETHPFIQQMAQSMGKGKGVAPETEVPNCDAQATKIAQQTNKQAVNMPRGAKIVRHAGSSDANFEKFFNINSDVVYMTIGIPPEIAMDKFGGSYSSSRASLKGWEYKMLVDRVKLMKRQFYKPYSDFWLDINVLQNYISAPGYLEALFSENHITLEAYRNCRFIGALVPHIDPLKEVMAQRKKLGSSFDTVPLDSVEKVMEELNSGDLETTFNKIENEKELFEDYLNIGGDATNNGAGSKTGSGANQK
jgi:capsid protein